MKKILYLTVSILVFFCFSAETAALGNYKYMPNFQTVSRLTSPINKNSMGEEYLTATIISTETATNSKEQKTESAYSQASNVTVLDGKQVKVKYDLWIVKFIKKLFKID